MKPEYKVLLIEDDFKVAEINAEYVEKVDGFSVIGIAKSGSEALDFLRCHNPDLILLDIYIPDVEGLDLLWKIREEFKNIDVIMVTAAKEVAIIEEAMRGGIIDYIIKPFDFNRFKKALKDYEGKKCVLANKTDVNQDDIDHLMAGPTDLQQVCSSKELLPKGISELTLRKIEDIIEQYKDEGITAENLGKKVGVSRITARRYLEYLVQLDELQAELKYGKIGRPERRYYLK